MPRAPLLAAILFSSALLLSSCGHTQKTINSPPSNDEQLTQDLSSTMPDIDAEFQKLDLELQQTP